ncbi:MAG TPA: Pr6Pr family membrane protein [Candidatus Limnocylindrales bacterium]|nr:Pr6Pr family membrane protein [Candidatus Limnocylindrales bacterium]
MDRRLALAIFRGVVAIVVLAAIAYQAKVIIDTGLFRPLRFFAFFTILSNLFGAVVWLSLAARWRRPRTRTDDLLRGAATLYLVVTFVVVVLLLQGAELSLSNRIVDFVVHKMFPLLVVIDWIVDPPETDLRMRDVAIWLIFPLIWLALTLIRGAVDTWYPYPFLDPDSGGYRSVAYHVIVILAGVLVIAGGVVALGDVGRDRRLRSARRG